MGIYIKKARNEEGKYFKLLKSPPKIFKNDKEFRPIPYI